MSFVTCAHIKVVGSTGSGGTLGPIIKISAYIKPDEGGIWLDLLDVETVKTQCRFGQRHG